MDLCVREFHDQPVVFIVAQKAYSKAGSVAEEVLGTMRTVVAFGAEEKSISRFAAE